jgi:hypothetical protein
MRLISAPIGALVPVALRAIVKGGTVVYRQRCCSMARWMVAVNSSMSIGLVT